VQSLLSAYLPLSISVYSNSLVWVVVIIILLARPRGILRARAA
jgi:branched-subunit amino acid ABC-type transport system permease component